MRKCAFGAALLCFCAAAASADQISLKNGDRLTGTIVKSDEKMETLLIKTDFAGDVKVKWDAIASIAASETLHITLKNGQTMEGTVTANEGALRVTGKNAEEATAKKEEVAIVRNDAEQKALNDEVYRQMHPKFVDRWSGLVDTGLSVTSGNSSTINYTLSSKMARVTAKDKLSMYATAVYGKNNAVSPTETIAHEIRGGVRGDLNVSEKAFVFAFTDFGYNELQHLDLQNVVGAGAGYHAIKSPRATLDLSLGGSYNQEFFGAYTLATPPPATSFPSATQKNGEIVAGESFDAKLNSRMTISESFTIFPDLNHLGDYRYAFHSTASTKLKTWLGWQVTFNDNYISNPPTGLKGNDLLFATGLRLTFGKGLF